MFDIKKIMNNLKSLNNKNAIHVHLNTSTTVTTNASQLAQVPLDTVLSKKGNDFSLVDNCVVINKNNIKVRVTARVSINRESESASRLYGMLIEKNSYTSTYQNLKRLQNTTYEEITCEAIFNATSGDKIYLDLRSVAATNIQTNVNGRKMYNKFDSRRNIETRKGVKYR